jgi:hypothetical protein
LLQLVSLRQALHAILADSVEKKQAYSRSLLLDTLQQALVQ